MRQMPGKVIRAKLFSRICAELQQIFRPCLQRLPIGHGEIAAAVKQADHRRHDQHIAALLHRHLIPEIINLTPLRIHIERRKNVPALPGKISLPVIFVQPVNLTPGIRISSYVMRRKIILPHITGRKPEHGTQHSFHILRLIQQEKRHRWVTHIHRTDAAVGVILFG